MAKRRMTALAVALVAAVLWLGSEPAAAQPCGSIEDQPEAVLALIASELGALFPLGEAECAKLTKGAISACRKAVSDTASCLGRQLKSFSKIAKIACSAQGDGQDACEESFEAETAGVAESFAEEAAAANAVCEDDFASTIQSICLLL